MGGGGAKNADVLFAVVGGVLHAVAVKELLAALGVQVVPQAVGGIQQLAGQVLVFFREGSIANVVARLNGRYLQFS